MLVKDPSRLNICHLNANEPVSSFDEEYSIRQNQQRPQSQSQSQSPRYHELEDSNKWKRFRFTGHKQLSFDSIIHVLKVIITQEASLCAQHCMNNLLQGDYFSAVDLADLASEIDAAERLYMAEGGTNSEDYQSFVKQPSGNMDDSGFFSVQVLQKALAIWTIELVPYNGSHPAAENAKKNPVSSKAFICNYKEHWLTVRKLGNQWFNLNSLLSGPELISNTYLALFLSQLQIEGYSIFVTIGEFPKCEADEVLNIIPAVQELKPRLLFPAKSEIPSSEATNDDYYNDNEEIQLQKALQLSLEVEEIDISDHMTEEEMLDAALKMSLKDAA
ncbi:Ataxin-3 [Nymphon striatum]|nr:Ataxin-3 [Nymphon striatum]